MRCSDTWVCVADGTRAQFFHCDGPDRDLEPVMDFGLPGGTRPFVGRLAGQLDRAARAHLFEHLVLVGPLAVMRDLDGSLDQGTRNLLVAEIDREDLTWRTPQELTAHLRDVLPH
ncbi:host attachment protein [Magnetospirillum sp. UT-4]|uniref:host attachment protein n=1 Tax=Magnetospirillum sp. UT-4 TaxID=2681467 RepID=UPI00137FC588|nr:host attachment protein [Magnetospirillum sp. UT-4]CAA7612886.1 Protein required for attachment to host cells [Magnetospirillum sp. UT-4]